ncbi:type 1 fimbrial protein [Klebsiella spallanzanii]|uniref:type 1 fimbrial protein n=1 Tax=Klebsiella spallanzanii TaxID=2587528 RepID=UPI0025927D1B|nr:type 1 fimbrial protein [Klebsiella spallanzanii]MDM4209552.1 type 1 fimbrial protein [Klebsiella spallanzanii]
MKKYKCALVAVLCALPGLFSPAMAEQVTGGVIYFYGRVVEAPCQLDALNNQVVVDCPNKKAVRMSTQQLENVNIHNETIASTHLRYINPQKTLAILDVNYR